MNPQRPVAPTPNWETLLHSYEPEISLSAKGIGSKPNPTALPSSARGREEGRSSLQSKRLLDLPTHRLLGSSLFGITSWDPEYKPQKGTTKESTGSMRAFMIRIWFAAFY